MALLRIWRDWARSKALFSQNTSTKGRRQVGRVGLPPLLKDGQHGLADQVGVALRVVLEFGGDGMRAEEGDGQVERTFVVQRQQGFEQAQLGGGLQAVAGLGFGGGGAVGEHAQQARARLGDERLDARRCAWRGRWR